MTEPPIQEIRKKFGGKGFEIPEEYQVWATDPNEENLSAVMGTLKPIVSSAMRSFGGGDPALQTRANILTVQALKTFDPKAGGASLKTHVFNNLQRLHRIRAQRSSAIHIPENVRLDRLAIARYVNQFREDKGYDPSPVDISNATKMSVKRVQKATARGESTELQSMSDKGDMPGNGKTSDQIWLSYVHHDLNPVDRRIFEWTTGYNDVEVIPKNEIARRLKISPPAVSQRISRIQSRIEEGLDVP